MAQKPPSKSRGGGGPSPRDDARRRGWDEPEPPRRGRRPEPEEAPWLDEADYEEEDGETHTLVGRRTLLGILFLLGVLTVGVVVGISLVSKRESAPIDVPAVGEAVPVLSAPGPWKIAPTGPDVDGTPVEGQGQVLFGTGDGRETDSSIALDSLPEDPLPRPGQGNQLPAVDEALETGAPKIPAEPGAQPAPLPAQPPRPAQPRPEAPRASVTVTPRDASRAPAPPKAEAPKPAPAASAGPSSGISSGTSSGRGQTLQLGAFSSSARARDAFKGLTGRYAYLAEMEPVIVPVTTDGKTLYRLRTTAASPQAARDLCGRLKVAGEACSVVD